MAESDEQYDALGAIYERAKHIPTGLAERSTLLTAFGDLRGKSVLDVARGTGFYVRHFHDLGAAKVVGVGSAGEMIGYADGALTRAGLAEVTRQPAVTPDDERGEEFWGPSRKSPSFGVFTAVRAAA
ncbi:hypothetical protein SAMN04488564_104277 [Lentzea waywayandensis]|uniref:Methyltransferase domain-containing protein n=1 Tax=Lentzea waywayandensis TaxID=84724 RepID=A0A1I6EE93_9PSEU|nr:hypothetical protein [Lentzea waywayandensis]SFR15977.1 hypothetical protein SAMN04488564_104277 [Lentzea waywayandensis]